jgi:septal ring factor EnvC (AmiA/AmiB activator)
MDLFWGKLKSLRIIKGSVIILLVLCVPGIVFSETTADLKNKVNTITEQREGLEAELTGYTDQQKILSDKIRTTEEDIILLEKKISENETLLKTQQGYLNI